MSELQATFSREWVTIHSRAEGVKILNRVPSDRVIWYQMGFVDPVTFDSMVAFSLKTDGVETPRYYAIRQRDITINPPYTRNVSHPGYPALAAKYPGPWTTKTRVQQLIADRDNNVDWYSITDTVVDATGQRIPAETFDVGSGLAGKAGWLGLTEYDLERVQYVKRFK